MITTYFRGSPLEFFDAASVGTSGDVILGGTRFRFTENRTNPRQIDFHDPKGLTGWKLVQVTVANSSTYGHAYLLQRSLVLNLFPGEPLGAVPACGSHMLWRIGGESVEAIERTVKKKLLSSGVKVESSVARLQSTKQPGAALAVTIDAIDANDDAAISQHLAIVASRTRGIPERTWPAGVGHQTLTFTT